MCNFLKTRALDSHRNKASKQIKEDFNLAKELSVKKVWTPLPEPPTDEWGATCSKSVINSMTIPNVRSESMSTTTELDDLAIAQVLQSEYDLEFDEELRKLEQSRNKSNVVKYF